MHAYILKINTYKFMPQLQLQFRMIVFLFNFIELIGKILSPVPKLLFNNTNVILITEQTHRYFRITPPMPPPTIRPLRAV